MTRLSRCRMIWPPSPVVSKLSLFLSLPVCRQLSSLMGGGAKSRRRESLVLYKSFSTLWVHLSPAVRLNHCYQCWLLTSMRIRINFFHDATDPPFTSCGSGFTFTSMKIRIHLLLIWSSGVRIRLSLLLSSGYWSSSTIRESPTLASTPIFWASLAPGKPPWLHCEPHRSRLFTSI